MLRSLRAAAAAVAATAAVLAAGCSSVGGSAVRTGPVPLPPHFCDLALFASLALAACGHVELHEAVLRAPSAPTDRARAPELYFEGRVPAQPYYDVALLQAIGFGDDANPEDVAGAVRARAQELGCDAVV